MKSFWKSKTLWFNALALAVMAGQGGLGFELPTNIALPVVAVGNALLRIITSQPVGVTDQPAN